jgi:hypothetical protein
VSVRVIILAVAVIDRRGGGLVGLVPEADVARRCVPHRGQRARHEGDAPMVSCIGDPPLAFF